MGLLSIEILIVQGRDPYFIIYETIPEYMCVYLYTYREREREI